MAAAPSPGQLLPDDGVRWTLTAAAHRPGNDLTAMICSAHKNDPAELWSYVNMLECRDKPCTVQSDHYDILTNGADYYVKERISNAGNMPRAALLPPPPSRQPAPRKPTDPSSPRGIDYDLMTYLPKERSLWNHKVLGDLFTKDVYGNTRGARFVPQAGSKNLTEKQLEGLRASLLAARNNTFRMAKNSGISGTQLTRMQEYRQLCNIWQNRVSSYAYDNISTDMQELLEHIDALQWEILAVARLLPSDGLPRKWRGNDKANEWFDNNGHTYLVTTVDDGSGGTKMGALNVDTTYAATAAALTQQFNKSLLPFPDVDGAPLINVVQHTTGVNPKDWVQPPELPKGKTDPSSGAYISVSDSTTPVSTDLAGITQMFSEMAKIAPLNPQIGAVMGAIPVVAPSGKVVGTLQEDTSFGMSGPSRGFAEEDDDDMDLVTSSTPSTPSGFVGAVSSTRSGSRSGSSLFSAKDLQGRIPKVNLQKGDVADLFRFGRAVQRYAQMSNCHPSVLLDTVISQGEPNERNLRWISKLLDPGVSLKERSTFFTHYRSKVLPTFSLDKLTEYAMVYPFMDHKAHPARVIASDYVDYMKPYLYLAKCHSDRLQVENFMKQRFLHFLGNQLRMSYESVLIQGGVDPFKLTLEEVVDALKLYSQRVGYEAYAHPDAEPDHAVMGYYVQSPDVPRNKASVLAARGDQPSDSADSSSDSDDSDPKKKGKLKKSKKKLKEDKAKKSKKAVAFSEESEDESESSCSEEAAPPKRSKPNVKVKSPSKIAAVSSEGPPEENEGADINAVNAATSNNNNNNESNPRQQNGRGNNNRGRGNGRGRFNKNRMSINQFGQGLERFLTATGTVLPLMRQPQASPLLQSPAFMMQDPTGQFNAFGNNGAQRGRGPRGNGNRSNNGRGYNNNRNNGNGRNQQGQDNSGAQIPYNYSQNGRNRGNGNGQGRNNGNVNCNNTQGGNPRNFYRQNNNNNGRNNWNNGNGNNRRNNGIAPGPNALPNYPPPYANTMMTGADVECWACKGKGHYQSNCPVFAKVFDASLALKKVCSKCLKPGHYMDECQSSKGNS